MPCREEDSEYVIKTKEATFRKWTAEENLAYISFLVENLPFEKEKTGKKPSKFYKRMSVALGGGRDNQQCRTHHKKMLLHYSTIEAIISELGSSLSKKASAHEETPKIEELSSHYEMAEPKEPRVEKVGEEIKKV